MPVTDTLDHLLKVGVMAAKSAGEIAARLQTSPKLEVCWKEDKSPATNADKKTEERMVEVISLIDPVGCQGYLVVSSGPNDHERILSLLSTCRFCPDVAPK